MQYWRLPATECADKAAPRNHHSRKTLTTGYPETGKPRPHSRMTEASALEGQPRRGREYADMQVPKYPHIGKHPRVCGEDDCRLTWQRSREETPPRMRGRPRRLPERNSGVGNTPAYAGKTPYTCTLQHSGWKHPRVCGEDRLNSSHHHSLMFPCWQVRSRRPRQLPCYLLTAGFRQGVPAGGIM